MKKISCLAFFAILFSLNCVAQKKLAGGFDHIMEVESYPYFGNGYLTITDIHLVSIHGISDTFWGDPLTFDVIYTNNDTFKLDFYHFLSGVIVIAVDGKSAKGWTKEQFYAAVDDRTDSISLSLCTRTLDSKIVKFDNIIKPRYELTEKFKKFKSYSFDVSKKNKQTPQGRFQNEVRNKGIDYELKYDKDFDFFPCKTYDYLITGNDPLGDKEILESINYNLMGLRRDRENPDLLFVIAKNADESINTTYVPPSYRTVNVGSKTTSSYNGLTRQYEYITTQNNYTVKEGGYTKDTKVQDLYLEITILDTKRLNDKSQTTPPIVWQVVFKQHLTNSNISPSKRFKALASWTPMITPMRKMHPDIIKYKRNLEPYFHLYAYQDSVDIIKQIPDWSIVNEYGFLPGDKLLLLEVLFSDGEKWKYSKSKRKKDFKEYGWYLVGSRPFTYRKCTILRGGKKMIIEIPPTTSYETNWYFYNPCPDQ